MGRLQVEVWQAGEKVGLSPWPGAEPLGLRLAPKDQRAVG